MTSRREFLGSSGNAGPMKPGIPVLHTAGEKLQINAHYGKGTAMSGALWCDKGEHAFSIKDPDRQHFTKTQNVQVLTGNSYGSQTYQERAEITEELDICGPCWKSGNDFSAKQINGPKDDQPTLQELEEEDENYRAGYAAAEERFYATRKGAKATILEDTH